MFNFKGWIGTVVDRVDPDEAGRIKVRIVGYHDDEIEDEFLPWAQVSQPITSAATGGLGYSPTGVIEGSQVWGIFFDADLQKPFIIGTIGGKTDVNSIATGTNTLDKGTQPLEPASQYNAKYPFNNSITTEGGHVIEYDNTPGAERLHLYHRKGSYIEMNPDGSVVHRSANSTYNICLKDNVAYVGGDLKIVTEGKADVQIVGDASIMSEGNISVLAEQSLTLKSPSIIIQEVDTSLDLSIAKDQAFIQENGIISLFDDEIPEGGTVDNSLLEEYPGATANSTPTETGANSAPTTSSVAVTCLDMQITGSNIPRGSPLYNTRLSRNYTLGNLSTNTVLSKSIIRDQVGLKSADIVCNLKAVAENILEPIRTRYPGFNINSGFRHGSGVSQHNKGQAVDLQWPNMTNKQMFDVAQWISQTLPIDQLIVEHGNKIWLHISYNRTASKQRGKLTTMINNRYTNGLRLHYR